jgi:hypothetical protein
VKVLAHREASEAILTMVVKLSQSGKPWWYCGVNENGYVIYELRMTGVSFR